MGGWDHTDQWSLIKRICQCIVSSSVSAYVVLDSLSPVQTKKLWFGSHQHATRTEAQLWTNSNRKLLGISHSCIIRWLPKEFILLPYSQRSEVLHQFWRKGVATLPWGARDIHLYFNQHYTCTWSLLLCTQPARPQPLVRSLRLVEVWPYREAEEETVSHTEIGFVEPTTEYRRGKHIMTTSAIHSCRVDEASMDIQ